MKNTSVTSVRYILRLFFCVKDTASGILEIRMRKWEEKILWVFFSNLLPIVLNRAPSMFLSLDKLKKMTSALVKYRSTKHIVLCVRLFFLWIQREDQNWGKKVQFGKAHFMPWLYAFTFIINFWNQHIF